MIERRWGRGAGRAPAVVSRWVALHALTVGSVAGFAWLRRVAVGHGHRAAPGRRDDDGAEVAAYNRLLASLDARPRRTAGTPSRPTRAGYRRLVADGCVKRDLTRGNPCQETLDAMTETPQGPDVDALSPTELA